MNYKVRYLWRQFLDQTGYFSKHNLTPLLFYAIGLVFLLVAMTFMGPEGIIRYLYTVVGLMGAVWLFSMVVLNRNATFYKDSVVKVSYVPLYFRMLPTVIFQTFIFVMFTVLYSAFTALVVDDWLIDIFSLLYYTVLGVILIIPFILLFLTVETPNLGKVNVAVFTVLVLVVPVLYLPESIPDVFENILSLNPFYYVVNGLQSNAVQLAWNIDRLPHDILFFSQAAFLYLWMLGFYSKMKFNLYQYRKKRQDA
ncbi:hypothetical protein WN59_08030 [Salinicoccus sediminis]|uniref:ABC-2 type transporter domain-containing protein n=1 Tax=Salinicoccus sediminis TaxID=1432562 RepID=A0A0M2SMW7_9STAP|nr:hypothetical protein [Salinicoccus sediminis]KKK34217.1 hypothetical protein WN59_08030 [Salinicoccus sediminis]